MEILQLDQPDIGYDRSVDREVCICSVREELLDHCSTGETFMSAVSMTYFFCASECLNQSTTIAYPAGIILAVVFLGIFIHADKETYESSSLRKRMRITYKK